MSKVSKLLAESINTENRATSFTESIKRNLQRKKIDSLIDERDKLTDQIFQNTDFSLKTDINSGVKAITREDAEKRIEDAMDLELKLVFVEIELKEMQSIFDKYFSDADFVTLKVHSDDTSKTTGA